LLTEVCPRSPAPGELLTHYDGAQKAVISRVLSYYNRFWSNHISDAFYKGSISFSDYQQLIDARNDLECNAQQGYWWTRSWDQSLPEEKGGAGQPKTITIGRELAVFEIGELRLTNTGQIKLGSFFFYIRNADIDPKTQTFNSVGSSLVKSKEVKITDFVDVSVKPRVSIKGTTNPEEILSNVSVEVRFRFFTTHRKDPIAALTIEAETEPVQGIASVKVAFELFCW